MFEKLVSDEYSGADSAVLGCDPGRADTRRLPICRSCRERGRTSSHRVLARRNQELRHLPDRATAGRSDRFRISGRSGAPAILSLIGPDESKFADYTYNGSDADLDVSDGGLNLRPLDGRSAVTVWSIAGNKRLRVGSRNFEQSLDFWHSGAKAHVKSTNGSIFVESLLEARAGAVLGRYLNQRHPAIPPTTPDTSALCAAGRIVWDSDRIYVCTDKGAWKWVALSTAASAASCR